MRCPACGKENPAQARFCMACAAPLARACTTCGAAAPPEAAFCVSCAAPLNGQPVAAPASSAMPSSFSGGRYAVRAFLGEGAKKRVYLARDTRLDRDVAFALIKTDGLDADGLVRVRREAQAMGRLGDHPHIVTIFDTGDEAGAPYIVAQHMSGGSVEDLLAAAPQRRIAAERAMRIAAQLADALAHAHARGVVHRDIKPGNIWLDAEGNAALGDFGLAVALDRSRMTMQGMMVGTVAYMAPEQALGRNPDARSDLYALGATLYEMVCGRPPFLGDDAVGVISQHINTAPVAPAWHEPSVPKPLEALILQLLAKAPEERPASAEHVAQEVRRILDRSTVEPVEPSRAPVNDLRRLDWGHFVGRRDEMDALKDALESALSGKLSLAFIAGEPGIGKTRLAEEFGVYAGLRGAQVLVGRCYEGEQTIPYRPFVDALRQYVRTRPDDELRQEMGAGAPQISQMVSDVCERFPDIQPAPPLEPEAERLRLFDSITAFLRNAAKSQPLVLYIDDAHWADKPTLLLLLHVVRHAADARLLVVATYRDVDLDRTHPFAETLDALRRMPNFRRIALRGLPEDQVDDLLAGIEPSEDTAEARRVLAHVLWEETEGNPFFLREILAHLVEEGKLRREGGRWTAGGLSITSLGIPEGIRQVIGRRLAHLSQACNAMLTRASTMTRGFSWDVLCAINPGVPHDDLLEALEEALAARIVAEQSSGATTTYDFTHALMRQTLYSELSGPRRVLLHRQVGGALEALWGSQVDHHVGELAYHFYQAAPGGDVDRAIDYCVRAGQRASALYGWEDAASHYERALLALELAPAPDDRRRCELLLALGLARRRTADERTRPTLVQAADLAERLGDSGTMARAVLALGSDLVTSNIAELDEVAIDGLERALVALPDADSELRAKVLARLALELAYSSRRLEADALAQAAIEMAERVDSPRALADALTAAQWVTATPHRARELIAVGDRILQRTSAADDPEFYFSLLRSRITLLLQIGEIQEIERSLPELDRLDEMLNQPFLHWGVLVIHAMLAAQHGNLDESERLAGAALAAGQQAGSVTATLGFAAQLIIIRLLQGRIAELEPSVGQFATMYPALDIFDIARAWIQMQSGAPPEVVAPAFSDVAQRGFSSLSHDQLWLARIALLADMAWYSGDVTAAAELYDLLRGYDGCAITIEAVAFFGSTARYLGRLAAAQHKWDEAHRHFRDAIEMDQQAAMPAVAWTDLYFAHMLLDRDGPGDRVEALALLQQVLEISQPLGLTFNINQAVALKLRAQGIAAAGIYTSIDRVAEEVRAERPALPDQSVAPDGTVTIMFSDIEDSTVLTERLGDQRWRDVLQAHDAVVRDCVRAHTGFVVKHLGDGFMVAFQSARRALDCAMAIQRAAAAAPLLAEADAVVRIRIGLHAGEALRDGDDFFGKNVIVASRVAGHARGGEILVSDLLHRLVEPSVERAVFSALDNVELKGLAGSYTLYAVDWTPAGAARP